jgi:hypothetical protein
MEVIKSNASYVLKLFINHFVSGVYSLVLFMVFTVAFGGEYLLFGSLISILFYLYLVYSFMWEAGSKRAVGFNAEKIKITDGAIIISVASSPFYFTTLMSFVLSFFTTGAEFAEKTVDVLYNVFFYINVFLSQSMYSGLFADVFDGIPNTPSYMYLLSVLPGVIVASLAYYMGSKNFRLRSLIGIKFNEEKEKIKNNY